MNKQRNDVEKAVQDLTEQIKSSLASRLYASLSELKIERDKVVRLIGSVNVAVDEVGDHYSKHFYRAVDALVKIASETGAKKPAPKSRP